MSFLHKHNLSLLQKKRSPQYINRKRNKLSFQGQNRRFSKQRCGPITVHVLQAEIGQSQRRSRLPVSRARIHTYIAGPNGLCNGSPPCNSPNIPRELRTNKLKTFMRTFPLLPTALSLLSTFRSTEIKTCERKHSRIVLNAESWDNEQ